MIFRSCPVNPDVIRLQILMSRFLRFIWNDAIAYLAGAIAIIGVVVVLLPIQGMPEYYGYWVLGVGSIVLAYRIAKSAALLSLGSHTCPKVLDKYIGFRDVAKIHYSFTSDSSTVRGTWQSFDQQCDLMVAYWKSYPSFHIAYWNTSDANAG